MIPQINRRRILATGGSALGLAALQRLLRAEGSQPSALMATLSGYMSGAATRALPAEVVEKTKHLILDTFAAMISGSELPPGKFAIQFARAYGGEKVATVAGSNVICGPIEAALANGMLGHADETDDTHPPSQSHPGCSVIPSALAVGEKFGIDGTRFLRAVALGYDIGPRVTITLGKLQYMMASHRSTHALSGAFGSAAAGACAAGLNAQQMRWLLSWTAQQASGLASWQRDTEHVEKAFDFGGMPARSGVTAALLVAAGGTGVDDVFSGTDNFFEAFGPMNSPEMLVEKLGERFEITRTQIKKWSVGAPIQAPLDGLDLLLKKYQFKPADVQHITVKVPTDEAKIVNNREISDINLQHLMAVMLIDRTMTFRAAHDTARMKDPAVLKERAKVQLIGDDELEKHMPDREAIVEVTLNDGTKHSEYVKTVRGSAGNPMTREEVIAKARDLITPVLGAATFEKLSNQVFRLENVKSIRELRPLLQMA
ncbi:MAG TPA: MmgE/PrpD family protein [Bryobacteraceae bacterium]|nr:MmgE/PrpD family protein [Bryobacteraceae bacterium]